MNEEQVRAELVSTLRKWRSTRSSVAIDELKRLVSKVNDPYWNTQIWATIGDMHEYREEWKIAREMYQRALNYSASSSGRFYLLCSIAESYCHEGDTRTAFAFFMKAVRIAKGAPGVCVAPAVLSMTRHRSDRHHSSRTLLDLEDSLRLNWSVLLPEEEFPATDLTECAERLMAAQTLKGDMGGLGAEDI